MTRHNRPQLLIIGIGNSFRGDDAAGVFTARLLKDTGLDSTIVMEHSGEGASLMEAWKGTDTVILIDAVSSGGVPGTIHRLEPISNPLPAHMFQSSTHAFSLPQAIEMGRALDELPLRLIVFGIEGTNFKPGAELSPEVRNALPEVAKQILSEMEALAASTARGD
jgi:hydrogenase maturation protease